MLLGKRLSLAAMHLGRSNPIAFPVEFPAILFTLTGQLCVPFQHIK